MGTDCGRTGIHDEQLVAGAVGDGVQHLQAVKHGTERLAIRGQHGIAVHLHPVDGQRTGFDEHRVGIRDPKRLNLRMSRLGPRCDARWRESQHR